MAKPKEWWQKRLESERKKQAMNKKKRETLYEASRKNTTLGDFNESENSDTKHN